MTTGGFVSRAAVNAVIASLLIMADYGLIMVAIADAGAGPQDVQEWAFALMIIMFTLIPFIKIYELASRYDGESPSSTSRYKIAMHIIILVAISFYSGLSLAVENGDVYNAEGTARTWIWYGFWIVAALYYLVFTVVKVRRYRQLMKASVTPASS